MRDEQTGGVLPAGNGQATDRTVPQASDIERVRRRWRLQQVTARRRISAALDRHCGVEQTQPGEVDYDAIGFTLGYAERRAQGLALLKLERAA